MNKDLDKYVVWTGRSFYISERGVSKVYKITYVGHGIFRKESESSITDFPRFWYQAKNYKIEGTDMNTAKNNALDVQCEYHTFSYPAGSEYNIDELGNLNILKDGVLIATHGKWDSVRYRI